MPLPSPIEAVTIYRNEIQVIYVCSLSRPKRDKRQEMHTGRFSWPVQDRQGSGRSVLPGWGGAALHFHSQHEEFAPKFRGAPQIQSASLVKTGKLLWNFTFGWLKGGVGEAGVEWVRLGQSLFSSYGTTPNSLGGFSDLVSS